MRSSCRFAVAVHVLAVLAYKEGEPVTSTLLASSVNTNPVVIRRLLPLLQEAGLIETTKGTGSGSRLSRKPEEISLADIYRTVETDDPFVTHSTPNQRCPVGAGIEAALEKVFSGAEKAMQEELGKTKLSDIVNALKKSGSIAGKRSK